VLSRRPSSFKGERGVEGGVEKGEREDKWESALSRRPSSR
jgi:hypothetical protein